MIEEMDKNKTNNRAAAAPQLLQQSNSKSQDSLKKNQDGSSTSKCHFPRGPRKRETPGGSNPSSNQNRKPQPQKGKLFDKRPRSRGHFNTGGKEDTKVGDEEVPELGSVLGNGSKKVNLNHLLNFHYTPKDKASVTKHATRWLTSGKHKYNKEQFLQANCQFVVKAEGDYTRYLHDPDTLVDWDLVEQIRVQSCELLSCPICLSPPVAAKMTRCGHVYCWPCILHYLALADKTYRKCPICYEAVHRDDLKSVIALCHCEYSVGDTVTLRLMCREKGSLIAVPVQSQQDYTLAPPSLANHTAHSKLVTASKFDVHQILLRESAELEARVQDEEGTPEICFTEQALELLKQRQECFNKQIPAMKGVKKLTDSQEGVKVEEKDEGATNILINPSIVYENAFDQQLLSPENFQQQRCRYESVSSEGVDSASSLPEVPLAEEVSFCEQVQTETLSPVSTKNSKFIYFYQASDGQHMYLHPINARMLESTYGSLECAPHELRGRILEKEAGSMTAELRHRLRHLQHLPVTCQFEVVEIQMRTPLVSQETMQLFQEQVDQRKRKRQRRARDERRREKHILEEENKKWGRYPQPKIKIDSHYQFPECGGNSPPDFTFEPALQAATEEFEELSIEPSSTGGGGPSFAQMLRAGKCEKMNSWPVRTSSLPVTTTTMPSKLKSNNSDGEPDPEGYVPAPSYNQSFCDAFARALEQAASTPAQETSGGGGGRKKKKSKQKVLLSTNMACNSK